MNLCPIGDINIQKLQNVVIWLFIHEGNIPKDRKKKKQKNNFKCFNDNVADDDACIVILRVVAAYCG